MLRSPFFAWLKQQSQKTKSRRPVRVVRESRQRKLYLEVLEDRTLLNATVSSVVPNAGPTGGTNTVTITGTNFAGSGDTVLFGSTAAKVTNDTTTSITAIAPAEAAGTVDVTVDGSATSSADQYKYTGAATVTGLSINAGPATGGNSVTISGTNFAGQGDVVKFGTTAATVTKDTATAITVTAPAGTVGTVPVTVDNSAASSSAQYTYAIVTGVSPNSGSTTGGNTVTINGTFVGSGDTVMFGTTAATVTADTTTSITALAPAGAAGTVDVTVDGSAANAADKYTYVTPPSSPGSSSSAPPSLNVPPLLGLINAFFKGLETVNANGTVTVTYSVFGFTFLSANYDSSGNFLSGAIWGITLPNFIWSL